MLGTELPSLRFPNFNGQNSIYRPSFEARSKETDDFKWECSLFTRQAAEGGRTTSLLCCYYN